MTSRTMGQIAAAARPGISRQLESSAQAEAPLALCPEVVEAAQVSATAP